MALSNYTELKAEIENHVGLDLADTDTDTLIDLAEARHKREVRIRGMIRRAQATASGRYLALPSQFLEMITLRLLTDPVTVMEEINLHEMNRVREESNDKPTKFTVHEEIEFNVTPDDSYTVEQVYYAHVTALSGSNTTNAILDEAPDLYLYGALSAAEAFLQNDERITTWENKYLSALRGINSMDRKRAGPLVSKVVGATP